MSSEARRKRTRQTLLLLLVVALLILKRSFDIFWNLNRLNNRPSSTLDAPTKISPSDSNVNDVAVKVASIRDEVFPNQLVHVTVFGLGHRLLRSAAAYHFCKRLPIPRMIFSYATCGNTYKDGTKIFPYLFGKDLWEVPPDDEAHLISRENPIHSTGRELVCKNDIYGYMQGQMHKEYGLPVSTGSKETKFARKLRSDVEFFSRLRDAYVHRQDVARFRQDHRFDDHTVIGLHLRLVAPSPSD